MCFYALTPKAQARGFVTFDDMRSAAQKNPALVAKARAFQQAFAMGVAKGIADGTGESSFEQSIDEMKPPAHLEGYEEFWKWGRLQGFSFGKQLLLGEPVPAKATTRTGDEYGGKTGHH